MTFYLAGLNPVLLFLVIFGSATVLTLTGLFLVYKLFHTKKEDWKGVRFITSFFTIIGALLGVMLTMVLVTIWQNYQKEKENVISETSNWTNFYIDAGTMDKDDCLKMRKYVRELVKNVIYDSWPRMERGEEANKSVGSFNVLLDYLVRIKPKGSEQELAKDNLIESLKKASDLSRNRFLKVTTSAIPPVMWLVITICAVLSVSCGFFFRIKPVIVHVLLTMLHAAMISVIIFLIISMMYPYRGHTYVTPEPFYKLLNKTFPDIDNQYIIQMKGQ